jgi:phage-related tail protein
MHAITMAIRQLSHRSMSYNGMRNSSGMNNGGAVGMRQGAGGAGAGAGALQPQRMSQAQSDNRMGQALRRLQGINMQLASQGSYTNGHARARGHVQQAMHELNFALSIR